MIADVVTIDEAVYVRLVRTLIETFDHALDDIRSLCEKDIDDAVDEALVIPAVAMTKYFEERRREVLAAFQHATGTDLDRFADDGSRRPAN
jgi:hypothetical protein